MLETLLLTAGAFAAGYLSARLQATKPERPMRLVQFAYTAQGAPLPADLTEQWRLNLSAFTLQADLCGLSERAMVEAGVVSQRGYRRYAGILKELGCWEVRERTRARWASGWSGARVRVELRHRRLSPPYPATEPPLLYRRGKCTQITQTHAV